MEVFDGTNRGQTNETSRIVRLGVVDGYFNLRLGSQNERRAPPLAETLTRPAGLQSATPARGAHTAGKKREGTVQILRNFWAWIAARVQYADEEVTDESIDVLNRREASFRGGVSRIEASGRTLRSIKPVGPQHERRSFPLGYPKAADAASDGHPIKKYEPVQGDQSSADLRHSISR
jgi:hypothetical protein